jgi:hypothetical protein
VALGDATNFRRCCYHQLRNEQKERKFAGYGVLIMASTISVYIAGLALAVNSMLIGIMLFVGQVVLAPIIGVLTKFVTGNQAIPMSDVQFLFPSIWAILIIMEIVCAFSFVVVAFRKNEVGYEEYY